jgi:hypothetical protein
MADYVALVKLYPAADIFSDTTQTVLFLERANKVLVSPFSIPELAYVLHHDFNANNPPTPQGDAIALVLSDIQTALQKNSTDNTFTSDTLDVDGAITQKRLAAAG